VGNARIFRRLGETIVPAGGEEPISVRVKRGKMPQQFARALREKTGVARRGEDCVHFGRRCLSQYAERASDLACRKPSDTA